MEKSEKFTSLTQALFKFHSLVGKIAKDGKNPFFKSNYATLSHILEEIADPLQQCGLIITQWPEGSTLTTVLIHAETGEFFQSSYEMPVAKPNDPQAVGSSISYARRYAISSILSLNIDDDDGNKGAGNTDKKANDPVDDKPWLNKGEKLDTAISYLKTAKDQEEGKQKLEQIKAKYKISKEMMIGLEAVIKGL